MIGQNIHDIGPWSHFLSPALGAGLAVGAGEAAGAAAVVEVGAVAAGTLAGGAVVGAAKDATGASSVVTMVRDKTSLENNR